MVQNLAKPAYIILACSLTIVALPELARPWLGQKTFLHFMSDFSKTIVGVWKMIVDMFNKYFSSQTHFNTFIILSDRYTQHQLI